MAVLLPLFLLSFMFTYSSKFFLSSLNISLSLGIKTQNGSDIFASWLRFPCNANPRYLFCTDAAVCVCKDANELDLQKVIDFACGGGADCAQIQTTGACYQPNTLKNHCDVAVNSYYQKKASTGATCDFNGAAVISTSPPSSIPSIKTTTSFHQMCIFFFFC